ncbi:MAG TPA: hypothetical protein PK239_05100 [Chitinophagales bacterium]|nr:hypothetical protein [Chitinophagales bacterium]HRK26652.1 hypothetical protein [Chitinophagales bacterium]
MTRLFGFLLVFVYLLQISCDESLVNIDGIVAVNIPCFASEQTEFVIDDANTYAALIPDSLCVGYEPPVIDFNERTLLGKKTEVTGCAAFYTRSILADTKDKQYIYEITVYVGTAGCDTVKQLVNYNWVTVPKLPERYDVTYKVRYR